jgi:predicted transposase YdaD
VTTTPHDALFKVTFTKLRHARGLLRQLLPAAFEAKVAWDTLRIESGIAVSDEDLDEQRMDILYSVRAAGKRVLLYVLAEHQSTVDEWMVFRLLCYLVAIWKCYRARYPRAKKLPLIVPMVVHHSRAGWTAPVAFEAMLNVGAELLDAVRPHVPCFEMLLDDLSVQSDDALRARSKMTPSGRLAVLSLKRGRAPIAVRIQVLSPDGKAPGARDVLVSILRYILETSRTEPARVRELLVRQLGRRQAEAIMTTAEMLRSEGRKEGRKEGEATGIAKGVVKGVAKGKREMLLRQLRRRFWALPAATVARIEKADAAKLDTWSDRVLTAESLREVLRARRRPRV